jgi:hypothetical protein
MERGVSPRHGVFGWREKPRGKDIFVDIYIYIYT